MSLHSVSRRKMRPSGGWASEGGEDEAGGKRADARGHRDGRFLHPRSGLGWTGGRPRPMHWSGIMRPTYRITTARPSDVPFLPVIELAAGVLLAPYAPAEVLNETTSERRFRQALAEGRLWVALTGETPVGFALVDLLQSGQPHLEELGVHPSHGRQGLGARLVAAVCEWAERKRYDELTLTTFRDAPFNMPFYARRGFAEVPSAELGPELSAIVEAEARRGLEPARRVVMRWRRAGST